MEITVHLDLHQQEYCIKKIEILPSFFFADDLLNNFKTIPEPQKICRSQQYWTHCWNLLKDKNRKFSAIHAHSDDFSDFL